jgi:hypothetical protein
MRDAELQSTRLATYDLNRNKKDELTRNLTLASTAGNVEMERSARAKLAQLDADFITTMNMTFDEYLADTSAVLAKHEAERASLDALKNQITEVNKLLWTVTTALFVVGGIIGAFTSKYVQDAFGRKKGLLVHHVFTLVGGVLVLIAPYVNSPEYVFSFHKVEF